MGDKNKLIGDIVLNTSDSVNFINNKSKEYFKEITSIGFNITAVCENVDFNITNVRIKSNATVTFNNCEFKARNVSMGICPRYQNDKEISVKVQIKKKLMLYSY